MAEEAKVPLSVAIITRDEEERLPDCLRSVSFADDIVVVDSGSTDATVDIARELGCRVFVEGWKGYGPQKQSAVDKCRHDWVLMLDADERIPAETRDAIIETLKNPAADAYSFPRKNFLRGKWIRHSDWWPDRVVRLFRKEAGRFHNLMHETWATNGILDNTINDPIEHFSFSGYSDMLVKMNCYSSAIAEELYRANRKTNALAPVLHGVGMFLKAFLLKRGFLDGFDGMVIALTKAGGAYFKYAKLLEMQRHGGLIHGKK